jgi:predicted nucleic acid-binding protein
MSGMQSQNQRAVFIDTSAIAAFMNEAELHHEDAVKLFRLLKEYTYYLFVSNYVIAESYALILNRYKNKDVLQKVQLAFQTLNWLYDEEAFGVLFIDRHIEKMTRQEILRYPDKLWSITDMTSFLLMRKGKIPYFLSFDSDFNQASYHFGFSDIRPYLPDE